MEIGYGHRTLIAGRVKQPSHRFTIGTAERKAAMRMARTTPTTIAGAAALIAHTRHEITARSDREDWEDWIPTALKTVAAALARMEAL